jgi:hypothetical protein
MVFDKVGKLIYGCDLGRDYIMLVKKGQRDKGPEGHS